MKYSVIFSFITIFSSNFFSPNTQPIWGKELQKLKNQLFEQGDTPEFYQNLAQFKEKFSDNDAQKEIKQFYGHKNNLGNKAQLKSYIKLCALKTQDEQLFKEQFKKYTLSNPVVLYALAAKELKEEANSVTTHHELRNKINASHFLEQLAQKEGRPWWKKIQQDHPWVSAGISFLLGATIVKSTKRRGDFPNESDNQDNLL